MATVRRPKAQTSSQQWYSGADVPKAAIEEFAQSVADKFHPQKIILFGSQAYGAPDAESDVDILVIMPTRNQLDQAAKISVAINPPFPLDIIVRTPHNMKWRLAAGDGLLQEIDSKGKVLYEAADGRVGPQGRSRLSRRPKARTRRRAAT